MCVYVRVLSIWEQPTIIGVVVDIPLTIEQASFDAIAEFYSRT